MNGVSMVAMWQAPNYRRTGENINIGTVPVPKGLSFDAFVALNRAGMERFVGAHNMLSSHAEKACNGSQKGWFLLSKWAMGSLNIETEQVLVMGSTAAYTITYTRRTGTPEDVSARRSLDTICAK